MTNHSPIHPEFTAIAEHYDSLMASVPYHYWVSYIREILKHLGYEPRTILDVACGTGTVSEYLADLGYQVTGVDISQQMIAVARRKAELHGGRVKYLIQDAAELETGEHYDLAISLFDSLNYIIEETRLARAMRRIGQHLVPGGYFIFDVNTEYALAHGFFNQSNIGSARYPRYVWTSSYDRATRICKVNMVFEVTEKGRRRQFTEVHYQKAYKLEELDIMLHEAGFDNVMHYHAYTFRKPTRKSDRVYLVARKDPETSHREGKTTGSEGN